MDIRKVHNEAMDKAELGDIQKRLGDNTKALNLYKKAYKLETKVSFLAFIRQIKEPTISILLKSSASLAMRCEFFDEAKALIGLALSGNPPTDIARELEEMDRKYKLNNSSKWHPYFSIITSGLLGDNFNNRRCQYRDIAPSSSHQLLTVKTTNVRGMGRSIYKMRKELENMYSDINYFDDLEMNYEMKIEYHADLILREYISFSQQIMDICYKMNKVLYHLGGMRKRPKSLFHYPPIIETIYRPQFNEFDCLLFIIKSTHEEREEKREQLTNMQEELFCMLKNIYKMKKVNVHTICNRKYVTGTLTVDTITGETKITASDGSGTSFLVPRTFDKIVNKYNEDEVTVAVRDEGNRKILLGINRVE